MSILGPDPDFYLPGVTLCNPPTGWVVQEYVVRRAPYDGPGWYIDGHNSELLCAKRMAQPDVKARRHPHYNGLVRRGWKTKKEAQAICDLLNKRLTKGV